MGKLTNVAIKNAKPKAKPYKLSDGHGLHILVNPNGSKYWRHNYRFAGKHQTKALGVSPKVSLSEARELHSEPRGWLREDKNPKHVRTDLKAAQQRSAVQTLEAICSEWEEHHLTAKGKGYREEMQSVLKRIEDSGRVDTAHRVCSITGQIFRYAMATGRAENDPTPALQGALKTGHVKHRPAITGPVVFGKHLLAIDAYEGTAVVCAVLKLAPLCFLRPKQLRHIEWSGVDLGACRTYPDSSQVG
jgi:hypothetical protein